MGMAQDSGDFRGARNKGLLGIAAATPCTIGLWLALYWWVPPPEGMEDMLPRLVFALKWIAVAVLLCLVAGVEAVAHERLFSPAFDPLSGFETRRLRVNQRFLQNTLEQTVVFATGLLGLAIYASDGSSMRAVIATAMVWIAGRFAFWIGYHHSAALRGLGAPAMAMSMFILLYVVGRFGYEMAGFAGVAATAGLFLAIEAVLFWKTSRPASRIPG